MSIEAKSPVSAVSVLAAPTLAAIDAPSCAIGEAVEIPPPARDFAKEPGPLQTAVLAGGCFWGVQAVYAFVSGVRRVRSGYAGGDKSTANYEAVCTGATGHAEAVEIVFDPSAISYGEILRIFFSVAHDPTQRDRQGPDVGTQYRSAIFPAGDAERRIAEAYIAELDRRAAFRRPIATRIESLDVFYPAEEHHQDFLLRHPDYPYIVIHDLPKIASLRRLFPEKFRTVPATAAEAVAI